MKKIFMFVMLIACNSAEPEKNISTVDPNVLAPDSNVVLDRDNPYDSSYSVALDSSTETIIPADTSGSRR